MENKQLCHLSKNEKQNSNPLCIQTVNQTHGGESAIPLCALCAREVPC